MNFDAALFYEKRVLDYLDAQVLHCLKHHVYSHTLFVCSLLTKH